MLTRLEIIPLCICCVLCGVVQVTVDGEDVGSIDSVAETIFTELGTAATDVRIVSLTAMGLAEHEWISLEEVCDVHSCNPQCYPLGVTF